MNIEQIVEKFVYPKVKAIEHNEPALSFESIVELIQSAEFREACSNSVTERTCEWKDDSFDDDESCWQTQCGNAFSFINGGIKENRSVYCQYCGGKIIVAQHINIEQHQSVTLDDEKIGDKYPDKIFATEFIGSNGIHCLNYRNYETDIEYIRLDKALSQKQGWADDNDMIEFAVKQYSCNPILVRANVKLDLINYKQSKGIV